MSASRPRSVVTADRGLANGAVRRLYAAEPVSGLVGWQHVSIGTDWPMPYTKRALRKVGELESQYGFQSAHRIDWEQNLIGFDDYRDFQHLSLRPHGRADGLERRSSSIA